MIETYPTTTNISSVGAVGTSPRPDNRVVTILNQPIFTPRDLKGPLRHTTAAMRQNGATRVQLKFPGTTELAKHPTIAPFVEGVLDASNGVQRGVIFAAHNRGERNRTPDSWNTVREIWRHPITTQPIERIQRAVTSGHTLTANFRDEDIPRMAEIWQAFGWDEAGIHEWLDEYRNGTGGWACGVRGDDGQILSLAKAELLELGDMGLVESTEWGTHPDSRRQGLGAAAAIGLNAQVLNNPPATHAWTIFAEANMAPKIPGHRVARDAGFHACADFNSERANGVLRQHVTVEGALRDFLLVQLTPAAIQTHYSAHAVDYINSQFTI